MRKKTSNVRIGNINISSENPIMIQSMLNTSTSDTIACVEQAIRIIEAGGELVRITAPRVKDAENLKFISQELRSRGYTTPISADIHFLPEAAYIAAQYVEKVRINPGNFVDKRANFNNRTYTNEEYTSELQHLKEKFVKFLDICKRHNTAVRIGTNHGSLSDRIMSRYGNTSEGMVEATMEYLRVCQEENFDNVVISLKSSDCKTMVNAVRQLVNAMTQENIKYPLHLGVTEAGEGEDGRIRSAIGIGCLLNEGIGDTIRVSLTEAPEKEISVCKELLDICNNPYFENRIQNLKSRCNKPTITADLSHIINYTININEQLGFKKSEQTNSLFESSDLTPEIIYTKQISPALNTLPPQTIILVPNKLLIEACKYHSNIYGVYKIDELNYTESQESNTFSKSYIICKRVEDLSEHFIKYLQANPQITLILDCGLNSLIYRQIYSKMDNCYLKNPTIVYTESKNNDRAKLEIAAHLGGLFLDHLPSGLWIKMINPLPCDNILSLSKNILQSAGLRRYKTEFISCPGCGRTLFNLESTVAKVKQNFGDRKGLKIAVMGCIVNGPGEMGDADYGYIGSGNGKVNLYKDAKLIRSGIPENEALESLRELIETTTTTTNH